MYDQSNGKLYTTISLVRAWSCTEQEYWTYRGWVLLDHDARSDRPGYLIEYEPEPHPNHPNHAGRIAWIEAGSFEAAYSEAPYQGYDTLEDK